MLNDMSFNKGNNYKMNMRVGRLFLLNNFICTFTVRNQLESSKKSTCIYFTWTLFYRLKLPNAKDQVTRYPYISFFNFF